MRAVWSIQIRDKGVRTMVDAHRMVTTADGREMRLNDLMGFDHVIRVHDDGTVTEPTGIYAPEAGREDWPDEMTYYGWELLYGYSGEQGYRGPWMHSSEFIGGGMADFILTTPGYYVAFADLDTDTWAVARREVRKCRLCGETIYDDSIAYRSEENGASCLTTTGEVTGHLPE
jgi:hypothetical protein